MKIAAAWWLSVALLSAQTRPEVKPEDRCTVEGTVVNAVTKEPVRKAQVTLLGSGDRGGSPYSATTDGEGRFTVSGVEPGQYRLFANKNGFARPAFGSRSGKTSLALTLEAGQTVKGLSIGLAPAGIVTGRVVDEDGEPMAHVRLQLLRYASIEGTRQLMNAGGFASTDDTGSYRMFGLEPGRYYLSAIHDGPGGAPGFRGAAAGAAETEAYPPVYYPGVTEPGQAALVQVKAGQELRGMDLRLTPVRTVRIRGRVTPVPVRPQEVVVHLVPRGEGRLGVLMMRSSAPGRLDAKGAFEIAGALPGSYVLTATTGRGPNHASARLPVEIGSGNLDGLELLLRPGFEVKGRVRFASEPDPNAKLAEMRVIVETAPGADAFNDPGSARVEADGSFTLRGVDEGEYRLRVHPLGLDTYLKAVRIGEADISKGFHVSGSTGGLEVVLSNTAGSVEGVVRDGDKPAAGATVTAVGESGVQDSRSRTETDQEGRYTLRGLAPGEYKLYAWEDPVEALSPDPLRLESVKDKAKAVTVEEKARATADLSLIPSENE